MYDIPKEISYQENIYYLERHFCSYLLDNFDELATKEYRKDLEQFCAKRLIEQILCCAKKDNSESKPVTYDYKYYYTYLSWFDHFKADIILPHIKKLGLENTWLKDAFRVNKKTETYIETVNLNGDYWTLMVAPPGSTSFRTYETTL
jgi:hypothetical protein